jgi:CHASE2 domain-containing sensor protein
MAHSSSSQDPSSPSGSNGGKILCEFAVGVALSIPLLIGGLLFDKTSFGEDFRFITYRLIQRSLIAYDSPIVVVDISELQRDTSGVTPRCELKRLLCALARQEPQGVGIDVDFSPAIDPKTGREKKFITPGDPEFFDFCQTLRSKQGPIRVFLGISRSETLSPDQWLGLAKYQGLAAAMLVPRKTRYAFESLAEQESEAQKAPTMGTALGGIYKEPKSRWCVRKWLVDVGLLERVLSDNHVNIDYSLLGNLRDRRVKLSSFFLMKENLKALDALIDLHRDEIKNKLVIVGDVSSAPDSDLFPSPLHPERERIAGVLIHASAAYTAIRPLFEIHKNWEEMIEPILILLMLLLVATVRWLATRVKEYVNGDRLFILLTVITILGVLGFGFWVNATRVVWDGFLIVAIALALHHFAEGIARSVGGVFGKLWRKVLFWLQSSEARL